MAVVSLFFKILFSSVLLINSGKDEKGRRTSHEVEIDKYIHICRFLYKKSYVLGGTLKFSLNREKTKQLTFNGSTALVTKELKLLPYGATVHRYIKYT